MPFKVFLSHSAGPQELGILAGLIKYSVARELEPLIPNRLWNPGAGIPTQVQDQIRSSDCVVILATRPGHLDWVNAELACSTGKPLILIGGAGIPFAGHENELVIID